MHIAQGGEYVKGINMFYLAYLKTKLAVYF